MEERYEIYYSLVCSMGGETVPFFQGIFLGQE